MIRRLLPLCLLRAAGSTRPSRLRPASAAVLCRLHPLDFIFIDSRINYSTGHRCFSARPGRSTSGFGSRDHRRGDLNSRGTAGQAKSLIEDEEELSDWISDLGKDSFRAGLCSNDEDSDAERSRNGKGRSRDGGVDRFRSRGGKGDSFHSSKDRSSSKMKWDDHDDDFSSASGRGRFRDSRGGKGNSLRSMKGRPPSRRQWDDDSDDFSQPSGRGNSLSSKGRKGSSLRPMNDRPTSRRQWGHDFDDSNGASSRGKTRNSKDFLRKRQLDSDLEDEDEGEDEEIGFSSRKKRDHGIRKETPSTLSTRGVRDDDLKFKRTRSSRRSVLLESDEEHNENDDDSDDSDESDDDILGDEDAKEMAISDVLKSFGSPEKDQEVISQSVSKQSEGSDSYLSQTRFDQCSISPSTLKGVKAAGYERMTQVQEATLPLILQGKDVLAKAKTGTGKTVAFLLPAIEVVSKLPPVDRDQRKPPINVVIICPTRELAVQAGAEADKLVKFHPSIGVQVIMGGTRLALEQKRMQTNPCQILVATPGRFRDHVENTPGFATRLMGVKVLILDEADRLLDMGFRKDIDKIVAAVPKQRQTLLFSATVPDEVRQICYIAMKRDLEFVNTVEEGTEETHSQVRQMHLVAPLDEQFPLLYRLLKEHISDNVDYKVIVFCTTAMMTKLVADLLSELKLNVREMHSRKAQAYRTRVSKEFKESKGLILVSSDVSARGVDYPNVTLVIQLGVPADREQYIHRLGRTGRKGQEGTGILMLAPWEDFFLSSVKDLPITKASLPTVDLDMRKKVERALAHVEPKNKESAYQAWLGYYNSNKTIGRDKYQLVSLANEFSRSMGLDNPPAVPKLILRKMGLNNVPGLRAK